MHIVPDLPARADTAAPTSTPIPFLMVPKDLGGSAAALSRSGAILYLDPTASREDMLVAIEEAAVYLRTGDVGSATRVRHLAAAR